ncbi:MAG: hypothetical protein PHN81_05785 [Actinomycetota bacterium]|jgi:hypothetical protein|nr:hypothetical protein [Actinomycetota bacterium]MDD5601074.1 hypothetical protein [Actinomycetota bacterium]
MVERKQDYFRVPITMPSDMVSYLENLGIECKKSGGHKIANTMIVRSAIRLLMDMDLDISGVKSEEELEERIKEAAKKY